MMTPAQGTVQIGTKPCPVCSEKKQEKCWLCHGSGKVADVIFVRWELAGKPRVRDDDF